MPSLGQISEFYVAEKTHGLGSTLSGSELEQEPGSVISLLGTHVQLPWELQAVRIQVLCLEQPGLLFPKILITNQLSCLKHRTPFLLSCLLPCSSA